MIKEKLYEKALDELEEFISNNNGEFKAIALYIECLGQLEKFDEVVNFAESLNEETKKNNSIKSALQKVEIKRKNNTGPSIESLLKEFKEKPHSFTTIERLADKYFANNNFDEAFELLINNYKSNKEKTKSKLVEFFEALGNENEKTQEYRKKFSSILFS